MKVLVTGGTGLLGYNVVEAMYGKGFKVYATHWSRKPHGIGGVEWIQLNLEEVDSVASVVNSVKPDIVVHTAAYTDVDGCEVNREKAYKTNFLATKALAKALSKVRGFLIYISTDYVFDGEKGMYKEGDIPNPVNFYGFTKLLGEVAVQTILEEDKYLVIRVSGLYGYSPTGKKNFGVQALEKLLRHETVNAFYDQYLSPTYTYFLAEKIIKALERGVSGVIHLAGERMSRYEFALALAEAVGTDKSIVRAVSIKDARLAAKRPKDSSLDVSKAAELGLSLPSQRECIKHFVERYRKEVA